MADTMAVSVKLDPPLEEQLRRRAAATHSSTSEVLRRALREYLAAAPRGAAEPSAHALGSDLFGRFSGAPDLSRQRKQALADIWADKHKARR
jgi:Arc/MetJ-type ribon-helix-helix transcriptional regulator